MGGVGTEGEIVMREEKGRAGERERKLLAVLHEGILRRTRPTQADVSYLRFQPDRRIFLRPGHTSNCAPSPLSESLCPRSATLLIIPCAGDSVDGWENDGAMHA